MYVPESYFNTLPHLFPRGQEDRLLLWSRGGNCGDSATFSTRGGKLILLMPCPISLGRFGLIVGVITSWVSLSPSIPVSLAEPNRNPRIKNLNQVMLSQFFGSCMNLATRILESPTRSEEGMHPLQVDLLVTLCPHSTNTVDQLLFNGIHVVCWYRTTRREDCSTIADRS